MVPFFGKKFIQIRQKYPFYNTQWYEINELTTKTRTITKLLKRLENPTKVTVQLDSILIILSMQEVKIWVALWYVMRWQVSFSEEMGPFSKRDGWKGAVKIVFPRRYVTITSDKHSIWPIISQFHQLEFTMAVIYWILLVY